MSARRKVATASGRAKVASRTIASPIRRRIASAGAGATAARRVAPSSAARASFVFHPLTPERWSDLESLFGERGACGGCWCMWPRVPRADFEKGKGAANKGAFRRIVRAGEPPGILAYANGAPAGWCAIGPRAGFVRLEGSRVLAPVDDQPVWSVVCFFIARPYRRQGLSAALLREAARFAAARGARIVEGYPIDPQSKTSADAFAWTGLARSFESAGFTETLRRSPTRPIMRLAVGAKRGGGSRASGGRSAAAAVPRGARAKRARG
jgi:GNAT superfamily N-acetyltransferase